MGKQPPFRLILASSSPARRDLLTRAGYQFDVQPADIDEPGGGGFTDARAFVAHVAWLKAAAVALQVNPDQAAGPSVILAADTVGWLDGRPIGKPADAGDARRILGLLSGRRHELWTGVCLWRRPDNMQVTFQEVSQVAMKAMTPAEITAYLETRLWEDCSGAYAIQEGQDPYVQVVAGGLTNVIGLPMETLDRVLKEWFSSPPAVP
jgi:septum formation protein